MNAVEIQHLTKQYGKARGIIDVSFSIEEGEIFGFIGPNGAGKSTTIRTLLALIYPTSGTASIFGKDCIRHSSEIKKEIGYLPAEVFYYDHMRVVDLLKYSASFYKKDCTKRMKELAERMDLDLSKKIENLSLGNKKKVGIVQGLLHSPQLLILDEPTSGLDPLMQHTFFELLKEENERGASILFSSHILSEVQRLCNRVAIIKEGRIVTVEKISALKESNYKKFAIETAVPLDPQQLDMDGVSHITAEGSITRFLFKGNLNQILQRLAHIEMDNLWIEEPNLEEIFMHYYDREA